MKKILMLGAVIIVVAPVLVCQEKGPPSATVTEIEGTAEIQTARGWERLTPLLPLAAGDVIRVTKPGRIVVMYLGGSPETITDAESPYVIRKTVLGKSKGEKAAEKLAGFLRGLMGKDAGREAKLVVRGAADAVEIIQPENTAILLTLDPIVLQWRGQKPPYTVSVFRREKGGTSELVFRADTNDTRIETPNEKLQPGASYIWVVAMGSEQWDAAFSLKTEAETQSLMAELSDILQAIPESYPLTRAVIQIGFFMQNKLVYEAYHLLEKSLVRFPDSEVLLRISAGFISK